jgi:hypothetical protein
MEDEYCIDGLGKPEISLLNCLVLGIEKNGIESLNKIIRNKPSIKLKCSYLKYLAVSQSNEELSNYVGLNKTLLTKNFLNPHETTEINTLLDNINVLFLTFETQEENTLYYIFRIIQEAKKRDIFIIYITNKPSLVNKENSGLDFLLEIPEDLYPNNIVEVMIIKTYYLLAFAGVICPDTMDIINMMIESESGILGIGKSKNNILEAIDNAFDIYRQQANPIEAKNMILLITAHIDFGLDKLFEVVKIIKSRISPTCIISYKAVTNDYTLNFSPDDFVEVMIIGK